jgi:hypothetical protein
VPLLSHAPVTRPQMLDTCPFASCAFFLTPKPTCDSLPWLSQEDPLRPWRGSGKTAGKEPGRGKKRRNAKKMFFDGTNWMFCCKQMTYKFSMFKTKWFLGPNELKLRPQKGQKLPLIWPRSAICGLKKRGRASLTGG